MKITGKQIAMARILLGLNQQDLADALGIARKTILRIENEQSPGSTKTLASIQRFFEHRGLEFTPKEGVQRSESRLQILKGHQGFSDFLDDVYETSIAFGTSAQKAPVYLSNVHHQNWVDWMGDDKWANHVRRMTDKRNVLDVRIIVKDGDLNFPASDYSQYKWIPETFFNKKSFYSYGDKLAFLDFKKEDVHVTIMEHAEFAEGYRALFNIAWHHFAKTPKS